MGFFEVVEELEDAGGSAELGERTGCELEYLVLQCKSLAEEILKSVGSWPPSMPLGRSLRLAGTRCSNGTTPYTFKINDHDLDLAQLQADVDVEEAERQAAEAKTQMEIQASVDSAKARWLS